MLPITGVTFLAKRRWIAFAVSLLVAISVALEEFFKFGERWRHYRQTSEILKAEGWQLSQLSGRYRQYQEHARAYPAFTNNVEHILQQELEGYITEVAQEKEEEEEKKKTE